MKKLKKAIQKQTNLCYTVNSIKKREVYDYATSNKY